MKMDKKQHPNITPKGLATIAAIESGLLPQVDGGWDNAKFKIFWEKLEKLLEEQGYSIFKICKD